MKKSKFIIVAVLIVVLLLVLWFLVFSKSEESAPAEEEEAVVELTEEEIEVEIAECNKQKDYFQSKCFQDLAVLTKDPEFCDQVEDIKDTGYGDGSSLFVHEGSCLALVAAELDYDTSLCERAADVPEHYEHCMGNVVQAKAEDTKDSSVCEVLDKSADSYAKCLAGSVEDEDDIEICKKVEDEFQQKLCRNSAYLELSSDKNDITYCEKIETDVLEQFCIAHLADKNDDLSICDSLESDHNVCVCYNVFFDEVSEEVCGGIGDAEQSATCNRCLEMDLFM